MVLLGQLKENGMGTGCGKAGSLSPAPKPAEIQLLLLTDAHS